MADTFRKGQKVRLMDSSEDAIVTSYRKGMVTVLVDGMQLEVAEKEVIPIDEEQEQQLRTARVPRTGKERKPSGRHDGNSHGSPSIFISSSCRAVAAFLRTGRLTTN